MTKDSKPARTTPTQRYMRIGYLPFACLLSIACTTAPLSTPREINEQCHLEMATARTAVVLREEGKPRERLASMLPPLQADSSRLLWQMHVILEESYAYPQLNAVTYATYRFEHCVRDLQNKPVPSGIPEVHTALLACQNQHGDKGSVAGTQCIIAVFPQDM